MQESLQQYEELVQNLERVVQTDEGLNRSPHPQEGEEPPLQIILHNVYRYLMAVAANLDQLHEGVTDARQHFLDRRKEVRQLRLPGLLAKGAFVVQEAFCWHAYTSLWHICLVICMLKGTRENLFGWASQETILSTNQVCAPSVNDEGFELGWLICRVVSRVSDSKAGNPLLFCLHANHRPTHAGLIGLSACCPSGNSKM